MRATLKVPGGLSTAATVSLTPSTAIEPFRATNLATAAGSPNVNALPALATALTIPVNICVGADQDVIPEAGEVEVGEPGGIAQMLDAFSAERPGRVLAPDEPRRDVRVNLVDEALGEEGCVDLPTALYEQADQVAL